MVNTPDNSIEKDLKDFIESIIEEKTNESDILEFKSYQFTDGKFKSPKNLNNFYKVICSFANTYGGTIILGIKENEKENSKTYEICDVGVSKEQFDEWQLSFRNKIAHFIVPSLYGIKTNHVTVDNKNCIVVKVARSAIKPHAFRDGSLDTFYIRNGNQSRPMLYNDLKTSFKALEYTQRKIHEFRNERISCILNGDLDPSLSTDTSLVIHIVPEWSLDEANYIDLKKCHRNEDFKLIAPDRFGSFTYNSYGLIDVHGYDTKPYMSYVQLFTNGSVEAVEVRLMNDFRNGSIYNWPELEGIVVKKIHAYCLGLSKLNITPTFYISISLLNTKGKKANLDEMCFTTSKELKTNNIKTPFVKWSIESPFPEAMLPILTTLAQTFSLSRSYFYDEELKPVPEKWKFT
ncbi:MAG: ATP-binding protein [Caldisericia bacterium]|nr:ATP-binding protein [Caldisericia bacterium]